MVNLSADENNVCQSVLADKKEIAKRYKMGMRIIFILKFTDIVLY